MTRSGQRLSSSQTSATQDDTGVGDDVVLGEDPACAHVHLAILVPLNEAQADDVGDQGNDPDPIIRADTGSLPTITRRAISTSINKPKAPWNQPLSRAA